MKLAEIAARINAHLKRFEADPEINVARTYEGRDGKPTLGVRPYYYSGSRAAGRYVSVWYVTFQHHSSLPKDEAEKYLAWLDAGNVGTHYDVRRRSP